MTISEMKKYLQDLQAVIPSFYPEESPLYKIEQALGELEALLRVSRDFVYRQAGHNEIQDGNVSCSELKDVVDKCDSEYGA